MSKMILVFGLSGAGKSWMCSRYAAHNDIVHVVASDLLRRAKEAATGQETNAESLRTGAVLDNQQLLIGELHRLRATEGRDVLFDGHNVIDDGESLVEIPSSVIRDLDPDMILFVRAEPEVIGERRASDTTRTRPVRTAETLREHQDAAIELACRNAAALRVPFHCLEAGDEASFATALGGAL